MKSTTTFILLNVFFMLWALIIGPPGCSRKSDGSGKEVIIKKVPVTNVLSYTDISAVVLFQMLKNKDFILVNVHIPYEGEIESTDFFIPYNKIHRDKERLPVNKDTKIILYCRTGSMSNDAANSLVHLGYTNVYNLIGGMGVWEKAGYAVIHKKQ